MHEAYQVFHLTSLTYQIESLTGYDDILFVGTRQGHLFMYNLIKTEDKYEVQLMRCKKQFSKKSIQQLEVVPEHNLLIILTDNVIQLNDIQGANFNLIQQIQQSKGATLFAVNSEKHTTLTGETNSVIRLAVVVKRKLQLYFLKKNVFIELDVINLNEVPKAIQWCQNSICIGYRGEYALIKINEKKKEVFPTSTNTNTEPCIVKASQTTFALCRELQTVLVNVNGETEKTKALRWSEAPVTIAWDEPYALGVMQESIEIQALLEPSHTSTATSQQVTTQATSISNSPMNAASLSIQQLNELEKVQFLYKSAPGLIYAASLSHVWCIKGVDVALQRKFLLEKKQFELALKLTIASNEDEFYKKERIHQIQTLLAYDLFERNQFHESMQQFIKLKTDPYDVIRLFPDLLPQASEIIPTNTNIGSNINPKNQALQLTEIELETGLLALIDYLTTMRYKTIEADALNARGILNVEKNCANKSTQQLLQIIDTTLLKCYLQTNDALIAPLLRLNYCHLGEAEKILKKMDKSNELIILYKTKSQHRKALELMENEKLMEETIKYLQTLGVDHTGLIIEFSSWVLNVSQEEGIKIFIEDFPEVETLPRPRILDFLLRSHQDAVIPYLEHVIHSWHDQNPLFHNALIHKYREKVMAYNYEEDSTSKKPKENVRHKLHEFLQTEPSFYTADTVLMHFPTDILLEERALILGKLGKHEQALVIIIRALGCVMPKALDYCDRLYKAKPQSGQTAYVALIKLLLDPNSIPLSLEGVTLSPLTAQPDLELALDLLIRYADRVNPFEILTILPDKIPVVRIHKFLLVAIEKATRERRHSEMLKGLLYAEHIQLQETRSQLHGQYALVTELNVCPVCKKRFGNQSALVWYPNGDVVHYSCNDKK